MNTRLERYGIKTTDGNRLIWWKRPADEQYWYEKFADEIEVLPRMGTSGIHKRLVDEIARAMPTRGRILEAGCGTGWVVHSLLKRGYQAEGVDFSRQLIEAVTARYPDLPVRFGDVTKLDVQDNTFSGYISLGVIEHRQQGCEPFLREAYRVTAPGGIVFISVPFFNWVRKKAHLSTTVDSDQYKFYQYGFDRAYFFAMLKKAGFDRIRFVPYGVRRGVQEDLPGIFRIFNHRGLRRAFDVAEQVGIHLATHMLAAVAIKPPQGR